MLALAWLLVTHALVAESTCHAHRNPKEDFRVTGVQKDRVPLYVSENCTTWVVRWDAWGHPPHTGPHHLDNKTWVGLFVAGADPSTRAPIEYRIVQRHMAGLAWFQRKNWRNDIVFYMVQKGSVIGTSPVIKEPRPYEPMNPRLAYRDGEVHVTWTQLMRPQQAHRMAVAKLDGSNIRAWLADTYTREDMCDRGAVGNETAMQLAPAGTYGWFDPATQFTATFGRLLPGSVHTYQVGLGHHWTEEVTFTAPPAEGARVRMALFGDMGNNPRDGASEHDFGNQTGQLGSRGVTEMLADMADAREIDFVVLFGDVAYSVGYLSEWDNFFHQVWRIASRIPWITGIGNHENGWSGSPSLLTTSTDSGGECGVPFLAHLPFSAREPAGPIKDREPWYMVRAGLVQLVMLSSEHEWARGSRQYAWLTEALASVDRTVTPWLVVTIHRPVLVSSNFPLDHDIQMHLQTELVPTLEAHGVDLILAGHHHSYQRMCKYRRGQCVRAEEAGIWSFVIGTAGYPLTFPIPPADYLQVLRQDYGLGRIDFVNRTHAEAEFVDKSGGRLDHVWLTRTDVAILV